MNAIYRLKRIVTPEVRTATHTECRHCGTSVDTEAGGGFVEIIVSDMISGKTAELVRRGERRQFL